MSNPFSLRLIFSFLFFSAFISTSFAQELNMAWAVHTGSSISASPVLDKANIYVGNEEGKMMCFNQVTGQPVWEFDTKGNIQGKALLINDLIFFESANVFYMLYKSDGTLVWKHDLQIQPEQFVHDNITYMYKLDPYDDIRPTGLAQKYSVFVGTTNGLVLEFDLKSGEIKRKIESDEKAPIRTTPTLADRVLYFGDWNGILYAYDLKTDQFLWKTKAYEEKPYGTFGSIASAMTVENGLLYFGARNPKLQVLSTASGNPQWSYAEKNGGWIIGDPVIAGDTLFIGGSDNFAMMAFNANNGDLYWQNIRTKNIYTRPVITPDWIIYTAGDGYDKTNKGELVVLNKTNGKELAEYITPAGVFSSPAYSAKNGLVYFGCMNGKLYAVRLKE